MSGALQRRAQTTYDALTPEQQIIARSIFIRLTALGEGMADTRRRVLREELYPANVNRSEADVVLQTLTNPDARLVVTNEDTVEVAHEALIRQWTTLREWLEHDRESLQIHRRLTKSADDWEHLGRDPGD